jgi:hypothetical protein
MRFEDCDATTFSRRSSSSHSGVVLVKFFVPETDMH